ncbi:tyrosine-type recombinase/integrase [Deinococcus aquaedulcis]|uniref:tyrosine-type recombinase/integrase n=1 Tax=Deinococcus aquaedulcis TaxID=2840455 RepID=UPI001C832E3F|nr:tyrosine-type recombinase/integrase [Deinococcus aquaedulcis]
MTWDELWEHFYYHLRIKRRAKTTLHFYKTTQRSLARYAKATGALPASPEALTVAHLRAFLIWLEGQGLAPGGIHAYVRGLKALCGWAHQEEFLSRNPAARLERPTLPRRRLPTMTPQAVSRLLTAARDTDQPLRDTAIVMTLFDTGIRLAELIGLTLEDLQPDRGVLRVIGKGDRERSVPIGTRALSAVTAYIRRERRARHAGVKHLFLSRHGQPLTRSGISIRLSRLAEAGGFAREETSPHTFRRGFAVEFLRNGGDVFTLQQILGHTSLEMTRKYVNFLDEDLKAAHLRFSPGDRL